MGLSLQAIENKKMKKCSKCKKLQSLSEFPKGIAHCKPCDRAKSKAWRKANPEKMKARKERWRKANPQQARKDALVQVARRRGITYEQYLAKKSARAGICGCCERRRPVRLVLDHNHKTNKTRDFICDSCNFLVGYIECHPEQVEQCFAYIERHEALLSQCDKTIDPTVQQVYQ